jgi:hypothetical protein
MPMNWSPAARFALVAVFALTISGRALAEPSGDEPLATGSASPAAAVKPDATIAAPPVTTAPSEVTTAAPPAATAAAPPVTPSASPAGAGQTATAPSQPATPSTVAPPVKPETVATAAIAEKLGDMIREKLGKLDAGADKALSELDERLAGNQKLLHAMVAAKQRLLKDASPEAVERFEEAGAAYTQYIVSSMGHHGATTDLAGRLFTQEDWEYMAAVTEEETRTEQKQYASVFGALPAALSDLRPAG